MILRRPRCRQVSRDDSNGVKRGRRARPCLTNRDLETFTVHQGMCVGRCEASHWSLLEVRSRRDQGVRGGCPGTCFPTRWSLSWLSSSSLVSLPHARQACSL